MTKPILRWISLLILSLCAFSMLARTEAEPLRIPWSQTTLLTWNLFQGDPPEDAYLQTEAARIHTSIHWQFSYSCTNGASSICRTTAITVSHTMTPPLSWALAGSPAPSLLHHEQLHFDLSEAYSRKLEILLWQIAPTVGETPEEAIDLLVETHEKLGEALLQKLEEMTRLYDLETDHSRDSAEQVRWEMLINCWLEDPLSAP